MQNDVSEISTVAFIVIIVDTIKILIENKTAKKM